MATSETREMLVDRLERTLTDPAALRAHLGAVLDSPEGGTCCDWDDSLLQQCLEEGARLELLEDEELDRLDRDPAALAYLGSEILYGWRPAWNELFNAGAGGPVGEASFPLSWAEVSARATVDPGEGDEIPGAFGTRLDGPLKAEGRAWVLGWRFRRHRDQLKWIKTDSSASGDRLAGRGFVDFELSAFARRDAKPGTWALTVGGEVPEDRDVRFTVELFGWNRHLSDTTRLEEIGVGPLPIELTGFGDLTEIFDGNESGGAAIHVECCGERCHWRMDYFLLGPVINEGVFDAWEHDRHYGYLKCLDILSQQIRGYFQRLDEHEEAHQALMLAVPEVMRRRYLLTDVRTLEDLSKVITTFAWRKFTDRYRTRRGKPQEGSLDDHLFRLADTGDSPEQALFLRRILEALEEELASLPEDQRAVLELREIEQRPYNEIESLTNTKDGTLRKRRHAGIKNLRAALARRGIDESSLRYGY